MSAVSATVEIFHDVDGIKQDIDPVLEGLSVIEEVIGRIDVVKATRSLRVTADAAEENIVANNIRWPRLTADMNLLLTERVIVADGDIATEDITQEDEKRTISGLAIIRPNLLLAIINTTQTRRTPGTTAHETGHLFNLKSAGEFFDDETGHCTRPNCIMLPDVRTVEVVWDVAQKGIRKVAQHIGLRKPRFETTREYTTPSFCDECSTELFNEAMLRGLGKIGVYIPGMSKR